LAESAITFRKASKAAAAEEEEEEEVEENPVTADPLLFICAPLSNTVAPNPESRADENGFGAFAKRSLSFSPKFSLLILKGSLIAVDELDGH